MKNVKEERTTSSPETTERGVTRGSRDVMPADLTTRSVGSLWNEMERMMEEFRSPLFGVPFRGMFAGRDIAPTIDVFEEGNDLVVKADLPGMKIEDVNVKVVDNTLVLSGEKKSEEKVERKDFLRVERSHGSFSRSLRLPEGLDHEHASANLKDGVLEIRIPKTEKSSVHQISVH